MDQNNQNSAYSQHLLNLGHGDLSTNAIKGFDAWYKKILPNDKNICILDYACGCGDFIAYLKLRGYNNVQGCDINTDLLDYASQNYQVETHLISTLNEFYKQFENNFDIINMKDIVEHIEKNNLINDLVLIRKMLKTGGKLIVSCPQMSGFTSLFTLYNDFTHVALFTESSLKYVLNSAGFKNVDIVYPDIPFTLKPTTLFFRLLQIIWFKLIQFIYLLERPGEIMPRQKGDRITAVAYN